MVTTAVPKLLNFVGFRRPLCCLLLTVPPLRLTACERRACHQQPHSEACAVLFVSRAGIIFAWINRSTLVLALALVHYNTREGAVCSCCSEIAATPLALFSTLPVFLLPRVCFRLRVTHSLPSVLLVRPLGHGLPSAVALRVAPYRFYSPVVWRPGQPGGAQP